MIGLLRNRWTYLIAGAAFAAIGFAVYANARPAAPVEIDGTVADYTEYTQNGTYIRDDLRIASDSNTYSLDKTAFHPSLPDSLYKDGKVSLWIDQGSTTIIAITLSDENDQNPVKHTTDRYDNPASELSDTQTTGIVLSVLGSIFLGIAALMLALGPRRRRPEMQPTAVAAEPIPEPATVAPPPPTASEGAPPTP